jgi:hypothetical protein
MHGLVNRAIQCFVQDTYGAGVWRDVAAGADLGFTDFEAMLQYEPAQTDAVLDAIAHRLDKPRDMVLEDIGTYLVSHPNLTGLRRLLRFGGVCFVEFLHSLDDMRGRARLAVPDLDLPRLQLHEHGPARFSLSCGGDLPGFGLVMLGVLRAMADDYGALVYMDMQEDSAACSGTGTGTGKGTGMGEVIDIALIETEFAAGRQFDLGRRDAG